MDKKGKGWDGQKARWVGRLRRSDGKITVGVCAREKKARSKHMEAITSRLNRDKFEVIVFGDACIMEAPVEEWPLCDCLVAFYSHGFPSDKAKAYVKLRRPYALNNLEMQDVLHDRRKVYDLLESQGVPHPENVYASRDGYGGQKLEELDIVEADDYIQVNSVTVHKPFVEKPVDAENHNVYIYYPMSAGGGSKRLFRKIEDRSSEFYPDANEIRREGSFVYESFVETQGTDVKVYTVGPDYGHAEARKSPTLDGKVNRNAEGKEIRYPVILTSEEKEYARKITLAFRQCVCGFDILRVQGRSFVCDVNGWSFVKNSRKYVDDCAMLLQEFIDAAVKPSRRTKLFSTEAPLIKYQAINMAQHPQQQQQQQQQQDQYQQQPLQPQLQPLMPAGGGRHVDNLSRINTSVYNGTSGGHRLAYLPLSPDSSIDSTPGSKEAGGGAFAPVGTPPGSPPRSPSGEGRLLKHQRKHPEELRAVIAITRHGDRTPKQKMKMKISFPEFLAFYNKYSPGPRKEIKVKGKLHLKEFLGITVNLIKTLRIAPTSSSSSSSNGQPPERKKAKTGGPAGGDGAGRGVGVPPPTSAAATPATTAEQKAVAWSTEPPAAASAAPAPAEAAAAASGTGETTGTAKEEDSAVAKEGSGSAAGATAKPASAPGTPREPPPPPQQQQQQQQQPAEPTFTEVDAETFGKLTQIKHVLERWEISGFNRKLQLKPRKWVEVDESTLSPEPEQPDRKKPKKAGKKAAAVGATKAAAAAAAAAGRPVDEHDTISKGAGAARRSDGGGDTLRKGAEEGSGDGDGTEGGTEGKKKRKPERASQLLLILKWGGELTNLGQRQAIELGNSFRTIMYPDAGAGGLLRLHSTFRHDLKIKTSDEGRVMKTAAAFAKGFLELEGDLTPILVSLVSKESSKNSSVMMLDPSGNKNITKDMDRSKDFLQRVMAKDVTFTPELIKSVVPTGQASVRRALRSVGNPVAKLTHLRELVMVLVKQLSRRSARFPLALGATDRVSAADRELDRGIEADEFATSRVEKAEAREKEKKLQKLQQSCDPSHLPATSKDRWDSKDNMLPVRGETPLLMHDRWRKLHDELYDSATGFDITKIPDVHDNVRYDCLHNSHLELDGLPELYDLAKQLADSIVPQEYGITKGAKLVIGSKMCHALLDKIKYDLLIAMMDSEVDMRYQLDLSHVQDLPINSLGRRVRTRLYFTSESHLHTLLNVLRFPIGDREAVVTDEAKRMLSRTKELCYLTSFVIRLFEDAEKGPEDPARFRVEILFSPGVVKHPMLSGDHLHTAPLVPLHKHLTCKKVLDTLNAAIDLPSTVPDDHSEAEAILHKLDKAARQQRNKESGGGGGGGGGGGSGGGVSDASTVGTAAEGGGGAAVASAPGGSEQGDDGDSSSHTGGREKQRKKQPCQPGGGGGGEGDMARRSGVDQQQRGPSGEREEEEDASGERQSWYYGGGGGWGIGKADVGGDAAAAEAANVGTKGRKEEDKDKDKEKEKEKENETRPRKNSWLSLNPVTRATSRERKPREEQLPEQQQQQQQQQQQPQQPQLLRRQDSRDKRDGGAADGGRPDGRSTARNGGVPPAGGANPDSRESQHPPEQQQKQEEEQEEEEEEEEEREVADEEGYHPDTGGDQEDGEEDDDDGDGTGEEDDEEEEEDGDGEGDDDDDDDDDDNEGFESDIARSAQARLTSDSYQSLRCESEFFCPDSTSSNSHTPDDEDEEDEDTTPMIGLNGRPFRRGRGHSRRHHVPKGSKKRAVARRSVGVDSRNEDGGGRGGGGEGGGGSGPRYSAATVAALGVLGAAAAGAAVMARARRR